MATSSGHQRAVLGLGIVGLGGAALSMLPRFVRNPRIQIAGAADVDAEILERFARDFPDADTYPAMESLCANPAVDLVYIATPNRFHAEHARIALEHKKHVLIEKPMTIALDKAATMIETADRNGVLLGVNVKHSFEPRVLKLRELVLTGDYGELRMIHSWRYADWLYRPRTPEELTPESGGGILWRQGPHQFDILRTIGGGQVRSVRGLAATWDPARRVPGAYVAYLEFEQGAVATAVFSGYDHFDSRELVTGTAPSPGRHARARRELRWAPDADWEPQAARAERYGGLRAAIEPEGATTAGGGWILGGPMIVSFDHADVRLSPAGLEVFGDEDRWEIPLTGPEDGRDGRIDTFCDAILSGNRLPADGRWGQATLEVLLAVEQSSRDRSEVRLRHQTSTVDP